MTGGRGRRRIRVSYDLKEAREYWKLKEEAQESTLWRTGFARGFGLFVRQTADGMNERRILYTRS